MNTIYTAVVQKKVTSRIPRLDTAARPIILDKEGKQVPRNEKGALLGEGTPAFETVTTDSVDNPLTDEAGNPVEAASADLLLGKVREHFREEPEVEVVRVVIRETRTVRSLSGEEFRKP